MNKFSIFLIALSWAFQSIGQTFTVDSVSNPKVEYGGNVSNKYGIISQSTEDQINGILSDLEKTSSVQVAVVLLNSIGDQVPADFATDLFNTWGIGVKGKDNGLLILLVYDQRRVEFRTGYGLESILPDIVCKHIQMDYMVPKFKENNFDEGILDGVNATTETIKNPKNAALIAELNQYINNYNVDDPNWPWFCGIVGGVFLLIGGISYYIENKANKFSRNRETLLTNSKINLPIHRLYWLFLYLFLPIVLVMFLYLNLGSDNYYPKFVGAIYVYLIFVLVENRIRSNNFLSKNISKTDYYNRYLLFANENQYWFWSAIFFPVPFFFYWLYYKSHMKGLRNHLRNCNLCQQPMVKLDEAADDAFLNKSQILEEGLNSIDYDVWICKSCDNHQILRFENIFSGYTSCPSCSSRTYHLHKDVTLVPATYSSSGLGERTYLCKNCNHEEVSKYVIAMKENSSGGGGSSSSSSSGSSFGGGSSGGGGAGSSW